MEFMWVIKNQDSSKSEGNKTEFIAKFKEIIGNDIFIFIERWYSDKRENAFIEI